MYPLHETHLFTEGGVGTSSGQQRLGTRELFDVLKPEVQPQILSAKQRRSVYRFYNLSGVEPTTC